MKTRQNSIDLKQFDFCDFGCSHGGSIKFSKEILGGKNGFGIDIDPQKINISRQLGYEATQGNFCDLDLPEKCVNFSVLSHVLEHLPSLDHAKAAIQNAIKISKKFVFIQGPYFDADSYLKSLDLKFYWSDWTGHTLHFSSRHLVQILNELGVENYEIYGRIQILSSDSPDIHPISSPKNQHHYESKHHAEKPLVTFTAPVFKEIIGIIWLDNDIENVVNIRKRSQKFLIQKKGFLFPLPIR